MITESSDKTAIDYVQEWIQQKTQKWLKLLVHKVLSKNGELVEEDIDEVLKVFLCEEGLIDDSLAECEQILSENYERTKIKTYESSQIKLISLEDVKGVNLIAEGQKLTFSPNLTVIYGKNASGKSGYVRILKKACGTRTVEDIWDNVYSNPQKNICQANIKIQENGIEKPPICWKGEQGVLPLSNIHVFDSKCVKVHLTDKLAFTVLPFGFEIFSMIANSITAIRQKLQEIVSNKKQIKDFSQFFIKDTEIFKLISSLNNSTKEEDITKPSFWSDKKDLLLQSKLKEIKDLMTVNLEATIQLAKNEKLQIERTKAMAEIILTNLSEAVLLKHQELISKFRQGKEALIKKQIADLSKYIIKNRDTEEWQNFIESAEKYIHTLSNHEHYPSGTDKCIYCQQDLTDEALALIKTYRELSKSPELKELKNVDVEIESTIAKIENLDFSLTDLPENLEIKNEIETYFEKAENSRKRLLENLKNRDWNEITFSASQEILNKSADIIMLIEKKISDMTSEDKVKKEKIEVIQKEVNELTDRKTLSEKKNEILEYLKTSKWLHTAELSLNKLNPKPVTDLSKRAWEGLVSEKFISMFEEECRNLNSPLIAFNFPGEYGAQMRAKSLAGFTNINDILSEGEQKAIALADFLAEASIKGEKQALVFDDPVASFDHKNREKIAIRLVEESLNRQVIIFTHDIMFVNDIYEYSRDKAINIKYHGVESIEKQAGIVSLDEIPMMENLNRRMREVKEAIKNAESSTGRDREKYIEDGYGNLRACCENVIIEKVFAKVVQRFDPEIKMSRLKDMVLNNDIVKELNELFEDCSRYILPHSHANPLRQNPPDINNLRNDLKRLEDILGKINKYRKVTTVTVKD